MLGHRGLVLLMSVVAGCGGCTDDWTGWSDVPTAEVLPRARAENADAWFAVVKEDADRWNVSLVAIGCRPPFHVSTSGGHRFELVTRASWDHPGLDGYTTTEDTEVEEHRDGSTRCDGAALHELGHAIGLDHADPAFGPSAMLPGGPSVLAARDVAAAACVLHCGPCEPDADPYDKH